MDIRDVLEPVGLALLATINVGLWTVRVALAANGRKVAASLVAGGEAVLFALVFGTVVAALDEPSRVLAYSVGVAAGTLVGVMAGDRFSGGQSLVTAVVDGDAAGVRDQLHGAGWPVTSGQAVGVRGPVTVLTVAADDVVVPRLLDDLGAHAPEGLVIVERLKDIRPAPLPAAMHVAGRGRAAPRRMDDVALLRVRPWHLWVR